MFTITITISKLSLDAHQPRENHTRATMEISVPEALRQNKERVDLLKYLLKEYGSCYSYEQIIWDSRWILWNRLGAFIFTMQTHSVRS
jgi:hypothetical protein